MKTAIHPQATLGSARHLKCTLLLVLLAGAAIAHSAAAREKESAEEAYERAVTLRDALESQPEQSRARVDFDKVIRAFQAVYRADPACLKTPASLAAVAELFREMGREFSDDESYRAAIKAYEFLAQQYPSGSLAREALFTIGEIYNQDLGSPAEARQAYERFLKQYPKSTRAAAANQALERLNDPENERTTQAASSQSVAGSPPSGRLLEVSSIHHWMGPDYTRIIISVEDEVQFSSQRVPDPDRLVFDLSNTRLSPALAGKSYPIDDGFVRRVRVGQNKPTVTRVVLDVDEIDGYSVSTLPNPFRLVVDIHGKPRAKASTFTGTQTSAAAGGLGAAPNFGGVTGTAKDAGAAAASSRSSPSNNSDSRSFGSESDNPSHSATTTVPTNPGKPLDHGSSPGTAYQPASEVGRSSTSPAAVAPPAETGGTESTGSSASRRGKARPAISGPADTASVAAGAPADSSRRAVTTPAPSAAGEPEFAADPSAPIETGSHTLTRALGLKINRIVIDPGHGGHDTGTIGPAGLCEKDLVLDIALRLKKLLETRMGSEVIMTRSDDTFIPLEERTAIANEKDADLFISIHANASRDRSARGIETYYLNFTSSPDALEVAARENAASQESMHRLQQLIEKIALTEKIEESRELARQVQRSLYTQIAQSASQERDRGLKKAPFVVLIGANMPSILSEISFLTNPRDEGLLKRAAYRQKIAEALYRGIGRYVTNLGGVKVAQDTTPSLGSPPHPGGRVKSSSLPASSSATKPVF